MIERVRLIVLFGGRSAEHEVSCVTAVSVLKALDPLRYDVVPVGITSDGRWVLADEAQRLLQAGGAEALPPALVARGTELQPFDTVAPASAGSAVVVLPLLHGPFGEDGTVQGLCELAGVPYVGSGVLGSALSMDKLVAKQLLERAGLPVPRYLGLRDHEVAAGLPARVEAALGWPVFVKPANLGSSVGVSKAATPAELEAALALAAGYDEWLIVEEAISGREIECGVLEGLRAADGSPTAPEASVTAEIRVLGDHEFYDFEAKYLENSTELTVPAHLDEAVAEEVRRIAKLAFSALSCEGLARVDFFVPADGPIVLNEVNTMPGFTPVSMFPAMWAATGVAYPELVDRLLRTALARSRGLR